MASFTYVILHYKNLKDTLECIDSIKKNKHTNIVVVDNHSLLENEKKELEKKANDLIILDKNYGFAKANNIGIRYASEHYHPDFVVVINNDIIMTQDDFEKKVIEVYRRTSFDALGPKIMTDGGNSVNPFPVYETKEEIEKEIEKVKQNICLFQSKLRSRLFSVYHTVKYKIKKEKHLENGKKEKLGVALHGCAIIFSKKYIEKYKDAFYNKTFLYHEEEFLYYRMKRENLIFCYSPKVFCFHKEGASVNKVFNKNYIKKELFRNKERLVSLELLYDAVANNKKI